MSQRFDPTDGANRDMSTGSDSATVLTQGVPQKVGGSLLLLQDGKLYAFDRKPDPKYLGALGVIIASLIGVFTATRTVLNHSTYQDIAYACLAAVFILIVVAIWYTVSGCRRWTAT